ncbi:MAG TPA: PrsW family glutamic-type intramembrane protease [Anaerolineae bacterium]|nr:PrsW family glutamic-type intramembrane protease [Anaerolineae bacterium]HQK13746.1 PrsW family glutamic-type intramembrane protease [Anaerolineae bacterium]
MEKEHFPQWLWIISAIGGGVAALGGLLSVLLAFLIPQLKDNIGAVVLTDMGLIAVGLGISLLGISLGARKGWPSPEVYTKWGWVACLVLLIGFAGVGAVVPAEWQNRPIFAPLHLGLAVLPAFLLLSLMTLIVGRHHTLTLRELIATLSGGAIATLPAIPVEIIGMVICAIVISMIALLFPGGQAEIGKIIALAEQWNVAPPTNTAELLGVIASPVVLVVLGMTLTIITPLIEELTKTLIIGLLGIWRRPGLTKAFLWGAVGGLGFAIVENVSNGANGLGEGLGWLGGMGMRAAATSMHMLTSGVLGLGWGFFWRKRWWVLPLTYLVAVIFHGLWNLNAVAAIGGAAIGATTKPLGFLIAIIGVGMLVIMVLLAPLALLGLPALLRAYESKTTDASLRIHSADGRVYTYEGDADFHGFDGEHG